MKNKLLVLSLLVVITMSFAGCGNKESVKTNQPVTSQTRSVQSNSNNDDSKLTPVAISENGESTKKQKELNADNNQAASARNVNYVGIWHMKSANDYLGKRADGSDEYQTELTIIEKNDDRVKFELGFFRITTFDNISAKIEGNIAKFTDNYNLISGTLEFYDSGVLVSIDKSNFEYIKPEKLNFDAKESANIIQLIESQKQAGLSTDNSMKSGFTKAEFNINYNGVIINDTIPFEKIANKLGFELGKTSKNIDIKAGANVNDINYDWYVVHLPNKEKEELEIEYLWNENQKTGYLISADLLKIQNSSGIKVGDDEGKLQEAYGTSVKREINSSTTNCYYYKLDKNTKESLPDKTMSVITDKKTHIIKEIELFYNRIKAMKEMDITAFD